MCVCVFVYFPGCAITIVSFSKFNFSVIFRGVIFLPFSGVCNFHSGIFQSVHFLFWRIPIVHFLSFSGVCFFYSGIFQVVHFPFWQIPIVCFLLFSGVSLYKSETFWLFADLH